MKYRSIHNQLRSDWFSQLPDDAFVRQAQIVREGENTGPLLQVSASTWWRWVRSGYAPKPVKLSSGVTAWQVGELRSFLKAQAARERI